MTQPPNPPVTTHEALQRAVSVTPDGRVRLDFKRPDGQPVLTSYFTVEAAVEIAGWFTTAAEIAERHTT